MFYFRIQTAAYSAGSSADLIDLMSAHLGRPDLPIPAGSPEHGAEARHKRLQVLGVGLQHPVLLHEVILQLAQRVPLTAAASNGVTTTAIRQWVTTLASG